MTVPRLRISTILRERMNYPKGAGPGMRMLVLESRYWLDSACVRAAAELQWEVRRCSVVAAGMLPRDQIAELLNAVVEMRPDFVLTINHSGMDRDGLFAHLFSDLGVPLVSWFVDDPRTILMDDPRHAAATSIALTWERAFEPYLRGVGFPLVYHLPLAADTDFHGAPQAHTERPAAFVGNSMVAFAARERDALQDHPKLLTTLEDAFAHGRVTRRNFAQGMAAIVGEAEYAALDPEARRHAEIYCFVEGTRRLRHALVARLTPEGLIVRGDDDWRGVVPHAGPPVHYEQDLGNFYRTTAVNLNSTSIQMATAVNQRVFDAPAAGGFVLTDAQEDLFTLFEPGVDVAAYNDLDECADKLRYYVQHPEARQRIVQAAQGRIAAQHTYRHRLQTIAGWIRENFGE